MFILKNIVATAHQRANLILRAFHTTSLPVLTKLLVTYVRPLLEFNTYVWNTNNSDLTNLIENVQRVYTGTIMLRIKLT